MAKQKQSMKVWTWCCILLLALLMIVQMNDYTAALTRVRFGALLQYLPEIVRNATIMFVPMIFGAVYSKRKTTEWDDAFRFWLYAVATLIIYYLVYWLLKPATFNMWQIWGILFPITTSSSIMLATIIFGMIAKPAIAHVQAKMNTKQNLLVLIFLSLASFALSAGRIEFNFSIFAVFLVLFFAWGMFLAKVRLSKKAVTWIIVAGIISFILLLIGVAGFSGIYLRQQRSGVITTWSREFMLNPTSPFMIMFVIAGFVMFRKIILHLSHKQLRFLIPSIIFMQAPIAGKFMSAFKFAEISRKGEAVFFIMMLIVSYLLLTVYDRFLTKLKFVKRATSYLSQSENIVLVLEAAWDHLWAWAKRNRVNLLTWAWFFLISLLTFVIVSDNGRIPFMTSPSENVIVYILGMRFFAVVLTAIFVDAAFTILYFATTRYWTSNMIVSVVLIGFAIATKIKMQLRGEPIYPSELSEATNLKSLLGMVNQKMIIMIGVALVVIIALDIFLEIKVPIKKRGSWKRRGIWALASLVLFLTPMRFNHENSYIHYLSVGFDNMSSFKNPQSGAQQNGPLLNFLDFLDMQIIKKPNNYSQSNVEKVMQKYVKVAKQINKHRKYNISKQTIMFNLSESFVDPYTFPGIKIAKSAPNPVKYIQQLKNQSTYGSMLSAGYGGGTANMEYESLTGLNMGLFKSSTLTPFVQVVPKHNYYPTIGMNFPYAAAIHDYYGTFYSRIEDYQRFKFNKFAYIGSKYKITDQKKIDNSPYNSDYTAYQNAYKQIISRKGGQFINLISMQNHMPYNNWYTHNPYSGKISGNKKIYGSASIRQQMATFIRGTQYTDLYVHQFIQKIDKLNKPVTIVFYGDHYPSILSQSLIDDYPIQMHTTRYFIYSNKYAREHGAKTKLTDKTNYVGTNDFIAMMLEQTDSKVTPYQALLTEIHKKLPAITINFKGNSGYQLVNQKGKIVSPKTLSNEQQALLKDYEMIQYDMTSGKTYSLSGHFYK